MRKTLNGCDSAQFTIRNLLRLHVLQRSELKISHGHGEREESLSILCCHTGGYLRHCEEGRVLAPPLGRLERTKIAGKGHGFKGNKALVVGAIQRGGKVRLAVIADRSRESLHGFISKSVDDSTEQIFTDDWEAYKGIADEDTLHLTVNHSAKEYVRGEVHTNGIENVWALLKRSIMGSYHHLSHKHLPAYLEEVSFKFNNRDNPYIFRDTILGLMASDNLTFQRLTA